MCTMRAYRLFLGLKVGTQVVRKKQDMVRTKQISYTAQSLPKLLISLTLSTHENLRHRSAVQKGSSAVLQHERKINFGGAAS